MINIQISDERVLVTETKTITAAEIYNSGAMDDLLTGAYWMTGESPRRILSIKMVRQITKAGLAETKHAMDARLVTLGLREGW